MEYCKLLLKMDPSDPLRILLLVDHYCIRSKSYNYLLEIFFNSHLFRVCGNSTETKEGDSDVDSQTKSQALELDLLPNFLFSCALAKYRLELESNVSAKVDSVKLGNLIANQAYELESGKVVGTSDELLQHAILMFPSLLAPLFQRTGVDSLKIYDSEGTKYFCFVDPTGEPNDLLYHPFIQECKEYEALSSLSQLITLYIDTSHLLWKDDRILEWLKPNLEVVIKRVEASTR